MEIDKKWLNSISKDFYEELEKEYNSRKTKKMKRIRRGRRRRNSEK